MLNNDLLSNRLNEFKKRGPLQEGPSSLSNELIYNVISTTGSAFWLVAKILMYGYSSRLIFNTDWNFWNTGLIGLTITVTLTYIYNLIHDKH